ncbi:hypothetical protein IJ556_00125 [bacterium]|nr:hypothetical protein [bacterium]
MNTTKKELIEQMTNYSVKEERLMCLVQLASYMMGRINVSEGEVSGNEEINKNYPGWLETVLDTALEIAQRQNTVFDELIQTVGHLK